jgi:hypothetical protein
VGFVQGRSLTEAGVLRFNSPTQAWVLDGSATLDRQVAPGAGLFGADVSTQSYNFTASVGPRWYRAMSPRLVRFIGAGLSAGYARAEFVGSSNRDISWNAGAYAESGLQYLFTRHFGLGWRGVFVFSRIDDRATQQTGPGTTTTQDRIFYHFALEPVQIVGTIFF